MKNIFFLTFILIPTLFVEAQNNLVFNEVLNFKVIPGAEVIVPENKVWKVEYLNTNDLRASNTETAYGVNLNNTSIIENISGGNAIWFSAGTILTSPNVESIVSILEFNVVPISSSGDGSGGGSSGSGSSNGSLPGDDYTPGESITDGDGNTYETVVVNGQTWTTTNLNVSAYRDGTPIPYISDFDEWNNANIGAYTYAGQDSNAGYGKLYNVYALAGIHDNDGATPNKILAPDGYHIPSPLEWKALIEFYMVGTFNFELTPNTNDFEADIASSFLKSQTSWDNNGNNESGLNIKKYPVIYGGTNEENSNFNNIADSYETFFATNQINYYCCGNDIRFFGVRVGEFVLDNESLNGYSNGTVSQTGTYIRLIKDY